MLHAYKPRCAIPMVSYIPWLLIARAQHNLAARVLCSTTAAGDVASPCLWRCKHMLAVRRRSCSYWAYDRVLDIDAWPLQRECHKLSQDVNCCAFLRALHDWQCPTVQELQEPDLDMKHTAGSQQPASRGALASSLTEPSLTRYADDESPHL